MIDVPQVLPPGLSHPQCRTGFTDDQQKEYTAVHISRA